MYPPVQLLYANKKFKNQVIYYILPVGLNKAFKYQ
jgi:hypothetical protein